MCAIKSNITLKINKKENVTHCHEKSIKADPAIVQKLELTDSDLKLY